MSDVPFQDKTRGTHSHRPRPDPLVGRGQRPVHHWHSKRPDLRRAGAFVACGCPSEEVPVPLPNLSTMIRRTMAVASIPGAVAGVLGTRAFLLPTRIVRRHWGTHRYCGFRSESRVTYELSPVTLAIPPASAVKTHMYIIAPLPWLSSLPRIFDDPRFRCRLWVCHPLTIVAPMARPISVNPLSGRVTDVALVHVHARTRALAHP